MARPKLGESETERLHVKITADEIKAIEDWRYANRVPSRSEAVRRLVQIGIQADESLDHLRLQADQTYEFIAARVERAFADIRRSHDQEDVLRITKELLAMCVETMQMIGNVASRVRQASDQSNTMKGEDDVAQLMAKAKDVERDYEVTSKRLRKILGDIGGDE